MNLFQSVKTNLKESPAAFGINNIRKILKSGIAGLSNVEEDLYGRTYTFTGLYRVNVNKHFDNILFESYDLPIKFVVNVIKSNVGNITRVGGYSISLVGVDRALSVASDVSIYSPDANRYVTDKMNGAVSAYANYITNAILKAIDDNKLAIDEPEETSRKNGLYTQLALNKFIAVIKDFISDVEYAPTNIIARLEDSPDYTDTGYNK